MDTLAMPKVPFAPQKNISMRDLPLLGNQKVSNGSQSFKDEEKQLSAHSAHSGQSFQNRNFCY